MLTDHQKNTDQGIQRITDQGVRKIKGLKLFRLASQPCDLYWMESH